MLYQLIFTYSMGGYKSQQEVINMFRLRVLTYKFDLGHSVNHLDPDHAVSMQVNCFIIVHHNIYTFHVSGQAALFKHVNPYK